MSPERRIARLVVDLTTGGLAKAQVPVAARRAGSERSYAPLTDAHLARLSEIAAADHKLFCRKHPEYSDRRVAVTLAQGAALHYLYGEKSVKDLDAYTFYARLQGTHPGVFGSRINVHRDFGPSEHRCQLYDLSAAKDEHQRRRWAKWSAEHQGRRVDLYIRPLDVVPDADTATVVQAIRE